MRGVAEPAAAPPDGRFRHEAVFYEGLDGFCARVVPFVREGVDAGEDVLVAVDADRSAAIGDALGAEAVRVRFAPMRELGRNPARIIPAWRDFVREASATGNGMRGVGEPIWPGRAPAELTECHIHESLLNAAFDEGPPWTLICPYDARGLEPSVLAEARRTHPFVSGGALADGSAGAPPEALEEPLEPAGTVFSQAQFDRDSLPSVRHRVRAAGHREGLAADRADDLALAVHEIAANSVLHGGGSGEVRMWRAGESLVVEVRDGGWLTDPLVGRETPALEQPGGRGLWLANQLCDLVQIRSRPGQVVVRVHASLARAA